MNGRDRFRIQQARSQGEQDESVPLYRSYGVKRRLRPWTEKIQLTFGKIILVWMACVLVLAACMCVVAFWLYFPEMWIKVVLSVVVALLVSVRLTRTVRKRRRFCKKLKNTLKVAHCNAFVNNKTLKLMEKGGMGCVNCVGTVNTSR